MVMHLEHTLEAPTFVEYAVYRNNLPHINPRLQHQSIKFRFTETRGKTLPHLDQKLYNLNDRRRNIKYAIELVQFSLGCSYEQKA